MTAETLCAMFQRTAARFAGSPALAVRGGRSYSWREYADVVRRLAPAFADLGVGPGESVGLLLGPSPEFHLVDTALLHAGAVPYSLQDKDTVEHHVTNLRLAGARLLVTAGSRLDHAREVAACHGGLGVIVVDAVAGSGPETSLADLLHRETQADFEALWRAVDPEDIATLIFTSGTTGEPKIVQLSHRAFSVSEYSTDELAPFGDGGDVLSYLPMNHTAERFMTHYATMAFGVTVHSVPDPADLYDEIRRVRPTRFFGIPRVYEKLADRAHAVIDADPVLLRAVEDARIVVRAEQAGDEPGAVEHDRAREALDRLQVVREALGLGRVEWLGVATAPSSAALLEFFLCIGLPISDIWGLSEIIMCTLNPVDDLRLGTVGRFLRGVEARTTDDGEIQVRGLNAFSGYLGDPERTAQTVGPDGWISTGDLGSIEEGYLRIRGRRKEILITSGGMNIAPAVIEAALKDASPLIGHAMAVADGRRFVTAVIAVDDEQLALVARRHGVDGPFDALIADPRVREILDAAVLAANATLARVETVRGYVVAPQPWSAGSEELTPTSKLRRESIAVKYAREIEELYV